MLWRIHNLSGVYIDVSSNQTAMSMKMNKNIFVLFLIYVTLTVNSQNHFIGVQGGTNWTKVTKSNFDKDLNYRMGLSTGFSYDYILKKYFVIGADIMYNQRGFIYNLIYIDVDGTPVSQMAIIRHNYDYLTIPLKVGFHYGNAFYCFTNIGLTPAILLDANMIIPKIIFNEGYPSGRVPSGRVSTKDKVNKFDIGGIVEVGGGYKFTDKLWFFTSFYYQHSFTTFTYPVYFGVSNNQHYGMIINIGLKYALTK